jgi:CRP-like cAMP-binding protein
MKHLKRFNENDDFQTKPGFVERRLAQQKEYESKYVVSFPVPVSAYELLKKNGVSDENIVAAYTEYVKHSLGLTYGTDLEEFRTWCEESDNLVDFQ